MRDVGQLTLRHLAVMEEPSVGCNLLYLNWLHLRTELYSLSASWLCVAPSSPWNRHRLLVLPSSHILSAPRPRTLFAQPQTPRPSSTRLRIRDCGSPLCRPHPAARRSQPMRGRRRPSTSPHRIPVSESPPGPRHHPCAFVSPVPTSSDSRPVRALMSRVIGVTTGLTRGILGFGFESGGVVFPAILLPAESRGVGAGCGRCRGAEGDGGNSGVAYFGAV
jgi:hypothetical protein